MYTFIEYSFVVPGNLRSISYPTANQRQKEFKETVNVYLQLIIIETTKLFVMSVFKYPFSDSMFPFTGNKLITFTKEWSKK